MKNEPGDACAAPGPKKTGAALPDFLIIGAAKSGTSTLYDYLARHPQIFMSPIKEPCFFDPHKTWDNGLQWYESLFADAVEGQLCGEASTNYTRWPQVDGVPGRIARILPNAKLIYLMRHPVDRAYSHYVHRHTKEVYPRQPFIKTFEEFVEDDPLCLDSSDYMLQITKYLEVFPREAFLFLFTENLQAQPGSVIMQVCRFLGVDDTVDLLASGKVTANVGESFRKGRIRQYTSAPLRRIKIISRIADSLPKFVRDIGYAVLKFSPYGRRMRKDYSPAPMLAETRKRLLKRYRGSILELENLTGVSLSHWLG